MVRSTTAVPQYREYCGHGYQPHPELPLSLTLHFSIGCCTGIALGTPNGCNRVDLKRQQDSVSIIKSTETIVKIRYFTSTKDLNTTPDHVHKLTRLARHMRPTHCRFDESLENSARKLVLQSFGAVKRRHLHVCGVWMSEWQGTLHGCDCN